MQMGLRWAITTAAIGTFGMEPTLQPETLLVETMLLLLLSPNPLRSPSSAWERLGCLHLLGDGEKTIHLSTRRIVLFTN